MDDRDGPRDECGVFGVYAPEHDVSRLAYFALYALQHRGQESAGIAAADRGGHILTQRDMGLVNQVFNEQSLRALVGDMAIGHVRYSTTGSNARENTQPVWRSDRHEIALAHNGNLVNAVELHAELRERGVGFSSTSDSEIIAALIATHPAERVVRARHHRRDAPARRGAGRDGLPGRARDRHAAGGRERARGLLRLRVHL